MKLIQPLIETFKLRTLALAIVALSPAALAQDIDLESPQGRAGYSIGINIGMNLSSQGITEDIDVNSLMQGLADGIAGELQMSEEEIVSAIQEFTAIQQAKALAAMEQEASSNRDFMVTNALNADVTTTSSGLQYLVLQESTEAAASPSAFDTVNVHYHGTLINGTVFDSSVERGEPVSFALNQVIPGWTEGVQLMSVGDKYRFFVPSELAYGANGAPGAGIGPDTPLIFEVELLGIN